MVDKGFVHHQAVSRVLAVFAANLADLQILPFDLKAYSSFLNQSVNSFEQRYGQQLQQNIGSAPLGEQFILKNKITNYLKSLIGYFRAAVDQFISSTNFFVDSTLPSVDTSS